jgi:regulator of nonsense transcripts 1
MPPQIGDFISQHVYDGQLKSNPSHAISSSVISCHFVDVKGIEESGNDRKSFIVGAVLVIERAILTTS